MSENPLLQISNLPHHAPPFDQIQIGHYLPAVETAIEKARQRIEDIKDNPENPDFRNTIEALETAAEDLGQVCALYYNALSAVGGDDLHALAEKIGPMNATFSSDIMLDEALFARVEAVYQKREDLGLNAEQTMLLDETYDDFIRAGAALPDAKKDRLREISLELSTLGPAFMNNVAKASEAYELILDNEADLAGLPDSAIESAAHAAAEKGYDGKWLFTLDYPSFGPFMQYADNRDLRENIWRAFSMRGSGKDFNNEGNILKITALRHERAALLGFKSHAEFVLERRMAERPESVLDFLDTLKTAYKPAAEKDLENLRSFARNQGFKEDIKPWDIAYFAEKLKQHLYDYSSEDLRPYLPLNKVLDGCFTHFAQLFHLRFKAAEPGTYALWHEDVQVFEVYDLTSEEFVGLLYADFHPRPGKKSGAWKTVYRNQGLFKGRMERPVVAIVCNFTKPTPGKPSLLTFGEVTTLFHEMGHAVHALLSNVTYQSLAGTSVLWDFVELPSQLQENWCYERETIDLFAAHYETGEKMPGELIDKVRAARNFMVGWGGLRQISLATLDMAWHHNAAPDQITDIGAFEDEAIKDCTLFPRLAGPVSTAFNHIFAGGYAAGYYSYKWAEVLDADTFELFLERGLYDPPTAEALKNEILSKGGSEHPRILYRRFRGRDADSGALLRREGLLDSTEKAA